jgi:predicted DNA-binding protein
VTDSETKAMTLRITNLQSFALKTIARTEGKSISDVIREAIDNHIEARQSDPEFQRRLRAHIEANNAILKRLRRD